MQSEQTTSFSIHNVAELAHKDESEIESNYNDLEKEMLDNFYKYLKNHADCKWIHWNMRDSNYGFPALAHRYKVLGGEPEEISDENLIDLSPLLSDIYGSGYIGHPHLKSLMTKNELTDRDFLDGKQEADTFVQKDYLKLHRSTLRKVDVLAQIAQRTNEGSLCTNAKWRDMYGGYIEGVADYIQENKYLVIFSFIATAISVALGIVAIIKR